MLNLPTKYKLKSFYTKNEFQDTGWLLGEPGAEKPSLIRAIYEKKQIEFYSSEYGIYQFADWMPIIKTLKGSFAPATYKSTKLSEHLGLPNLYITFSGFFPEKGVEMKTGTFKETEAYSVCARITKDMENKAIVVASAGNTARAFANVCSKNNIPLLLCMPYDCIDALWFDEPINPCVKLVCTPSGTDYYDAIWLSDEICKLPNFIAEGGAKNVARRDGMATTMLSATKEIGEIPDYYFQSVGSGTGAIAAWEANLRLLEDGRFGKNKAKLMLSQNYPFVPMSQAWRNNSRQLPEMPDEETKKQIQGLHAVVLSNRKPPYGIYGGLFDALTDAGGHFFEIDNEYAKKTAELFETLEGIDLQPAAAVAVASLIDAAKNNMIEKDKIVMINITGGGEKLFRKDRKIYNLLPNYVAKHGENIENIKSVVEKFDFK